MALCQCDFCRGLVRWAPADFMSINWATEQPIIEVVCHEYNVDAAFLMAIREQENGRPGLEWGVKSVAAATYDDQLRIACITVAHRLVSFPNNPLTRGPVSRRLMYSHTWINYFGAIWAPADASPMNVVWIPNVTQFYAEWVLKGV